jgi:hypothetical protein
MREIRPSGSVRGVRRKPYPYRDIIHPVRSTAPVAVQIIACLEIGRSALSKVILLRFDSAFQVI